MSSVISCKLTIKYSEGQKINANVLVFIENRQFVFKQGNETFYLDFDQIKDYKTTTETSKVQSIRLKIPSQFIAISFSTLIPAGEPVECNEIFLIMTSSTGRADALALENALSRDKSESQAVLAPAIQQTHLEFEEETISTKKKFTRQEVDPNQYYEEVTTVIKQFNPLIRLTQKEAEKIIDDKDFWRGNADTVFKQAMRPSKQVVGDPSKLTLNEAVLAVYESRDQTNMNSELIHRADFTHRLLKHAEKISSNRSAISLNTSIANGITGKSDNRPLPVAEICDKLLDDLEPTPEINFIPIESHDSQIAQNSKTVAVKPDDLLSSLKTSKPKSALSDVQFRSFIDSNAKSQEMNLDEYSKALQINATAKTLLFHFYSHLDSAVRNGKYPPLNTSRGKKLDKLTKAITKLREKLSMMDDMKNKTCINAITNSLKNALLYRSRIEYSFNK